MKLKRISGSVLGWILFAYCTTGWMLMSCSSDEQETKDPVEESSGDDQKGEEEEEEEGYEEGEEAANEYSDEVEETAQEILNGDDGAAEEVEEEATGAAETLEGIMNSGPADASAAAGEDAEYEESEEGETIEPDAPAVVDSSAGMESLKTPGGVNTKDTKIGKGMESSGGMAAVAPATIPDGTSAVLYVKAARANVRQGPGTSNAVVGSLVQGDRVVATIEGDWARTNKGTYIAASLLSLKPVGRARPAGLWSSQR